MLFLSRILAGIFIAATYPTAQAFISDNTNEEDRAKNFGFYGAAIGLGFTIGPVVGGILSGIEDLIIFSDYTYLIPTLLVFVLEVITLLIGFHIIPKDQVNEIRIDNIDLQKVIISPGSKNSIKLQRKYYTIIIIFILFATTSFVFSSMDATLTLYDKVYFGLNEVFIGSLLFLVGIIVLPIQGVLIGPLSKKLRDELLIASGIFILILGLLGLTQANSVLMLGIYTVFLMGGFAIIQPTLASLLTKQVTSKHKGTILGLNESLGSFMRILGPLIGSFAFDLNVVLPFYLGAMLLIFSILTVLIIFLLLKIKSVFNIKDNLLPSIKLKGNLSCS